MKHYIGSACGMCFLNFCKKDTNRKQMQKSVILFPSCELPQHSPVRLLLHVAISSCCYISSELHWTTIFLTVSCMLIQLYIFIYLLVDERKKWDQLNSQWEEIEWKVEVDQTDKAERRACGKDIKAWDVCSVYGGTVRKEAELVEAKPWEPHMSC